MPSYYILVAFSYSIGIAAIIGLVRFKKALRIYRPFIYLTWLAFASEIINTISSLLFKNNIFITNFYVLAEAILFAWLFHNWGALQQKKWHYPVTLGILVAVWASDVLFWHGFTSLLSLFHITYSFVLIFLAIDQLNKVIVQERGNILHNSKFLICTGIIIFYTYNATIEVFFLAKFKASDSFYRDVYLIMEFINLFVNLIYALAALWIPTRQRFTPSS